MTIKIELQKKKKKRKEKIPPDGFTILENVPEGCTIQNHGKVKEITGGEKDRLEVKTRGVQQLIKTHVNEEII